MLLTETVPGQRCAPMANFQWKKLGGFRSGCEKLGNQLQLEPADLYWNVRRDELTPFDQKRIGEDLPLQ